MAAAADEPEKSGLSYRLYASAEPNESEYCSRLKRRASSIESFDMVGLARPRAIFSEMSRPVALHEGKRVSQVHSGTADDRASTSPRRKARK